MNSKENNIEKINRMFLEGKLDWADKEQLIQQELNKNNKYRKLCQRRTFKN